MIKVLKTFLFGLLLHLYMQIDILIQIKAYDSASDFFSTIIALALPIVFGVVVYYKFKNIKKVDFWVTQIWFVALFIFFLVLGTATDYFEWLFNLTNLDIFYDETYYELTFNAMFDGLAHTISIIVVCVIYLIKSKKRK